MRNSKMETHSKTLEGMRMQPSAWTLTWVLTGTLILQDLARTYIRPYLKNALTTLHLSGGDYDSRMRSSEVSCASDRIDNELMVA